MKHVTIPEGGWGLSTRSVKAHFFHFHNGYALCSSSVFHGELLALKPEMPARAWCCATCRRLYEERRARVCLEEMA